MSKSTLKKGRLVLALFAFLVFLILVPGPTIFLNLLLAKIIPGTTEATVTYDRARAGLFLKSASISGLKVEFTDSSGQRQPFQADSLQLDGLSASNLIKLIFQPESPAPEPGFLAEELRVANLRRQDSGGDRIKSLRLRNVALINAPARFQPPIHFEKLEVEDFSWGLTEETGPYRLKIAGLEARNLSFDSLAELKVRAFDFSPESPAGPQAPFNLNIGGLTVGGLKTEALSRVLAGGGQQSLWWVLSGCDSLDLVQARLSQGEGEALTLKSALFDHHENGPEIRYIRRLNFSADLPLLSRGSGEPVWGDLIDLFGQRPEGQLAIEFNYDRSSRLAELKSLNLEMPDLGRLELTGSLNGVSPLPPHSSPSQLLFDSRNWRLAGLGLIFQNQGFMSNYYRHLNRTVFQNLPGYQTVDNIMEYFVKPIADDLEYEQGLANLPVLLSEVEAFFRRPESLRLRAEPDPPMALALANLDKYDIIEKLRLALEVNDRAPVAVAVASGVFHERLPSSPRPMEKLFTEEDI